MDVVGRRLARVPTWLAVVVLALVGGVLPVLVAHHYGALGIPRNDDWSYGLTAFRLGETGRFDLNGWAAVNVVGQIIPAIPAVWAFGRRFTPLQLGVVTLGVVGLVAVFDVGRALVSRPRALFVALVVAVSPLWAPLAVSYMTDVPAFALAMVTLALAVRALRGSGRAGTDRIRTGPYTAALVVGFWAYTVRDSAIVATLALTVVGGWCAWRGTRHDRRVVLGGALGWVLAGAAFLAWKQGATGYQTPSFMLDPGVAKTAVRRSAQMLPTLGVLIAPSVVLAGPMRAVRASFARAPRAAALVGVAVGATAVTIMAVWGRPLGPGNYLEENGTVGTYLLPGFRAALFPAWTMAVLGAVGALAVTIAAIAAVRPLSDQWVRARSRGLAGPNDPGLMVVSLAGLGFGGFIVASGVAGNALWDRYLLVVVPLLSLCLLRAVHPDPGVPARPRRVAAGVTLAALGIIGLVFGMNSASYDGARWEVATAATRVVGDPAQVDGGFEWVDYHAGAEIHLSERAGRRRCVVLRSEAAAPRPGDAEVVAAKPVWGPTGTQAWIVARSTGRCRIG